MQRVTTGLLTVCVLVMLACPTTGQGATNTWRGVNTAALYDYSLTLEPDWLPSDYRQANAAQAPDGYSLWSFGAVPGSTDTALFEWDTAETSVWSYEDGKVLVTDGFSVEHLAVKSTASGYASASSQAQIVTSGDVSAQTLHFNFAANGEGILLISDGTLRLTGEENPVSFAGSRGSWQSINVGPDGTLVFDAPHQHFGSFGYYWSAWNGEARVGGSGAITFPRSKAEITLEAPGNSTSGNILTGSTALRVRSDQSWLNPSRTGYITRFVSNNGRLVESIDGVPLHNLSNTVFRVLSYSGASPYYVPEASFQGLQLRSYVSSSGRTCNYMLEGDISLTGGSVTPGTATVPAAEETYGLHVFGDHCGSSILNLGGYNVTTSRGLYIDSKPNLTYPDRKGVARISGTAGSTLNIGGDLVVRTVAFAPGYTNAVGALDENRGTGITGDETLTVNLHGSFSSNVRSIANQSNLSVATVNLLGGTPESPVTWEVGNDPADRCVSGTLAVGQLNIGTSGHPAQVQLVNDYLNDNDPSNPLKTKEGEILVVGDLSLADGARLDLNGLGLKVTESLDLAPTAVLDLQTGIDFEVGEIYTKVVGVGDQIDAWNAFRSQVVDSTASSRQFRAVGVEKSPLPFGGSSIELLLDGDSDIVDLSAVGDGLGANLSSFTLEAWLKPSELSSSASDNDYPYAIIRSSASGSRPSIGTSTYFMGMVKTSNNYTACVSGQYVLGDTGVAAAIGVWRHIALTYDGTTQRVYVDGELKAEAAVSPPTGTAINNLGIGGCSSDPSYRDFNGTISEVRVWNVVRSAEDIQATLHTRLNGSESGLVGYWPLDEGSGAVAHDRSAVGGKNGVIRNDFAWSSRYEATCWQYAGAGASVIIIR